MDPTITLFPGSGFYQHKRKHSRPAARSRTTEKSASRTKEATNTAGNIPRSKKKPEAHMENLKSLKISEVTNFSESVIQRVLAAKPEALLDAFFYLARINIQMSCDPSADPETKTVLSLYQIQEALDQNIIDVQKIFGRESEEPETTGPIQ
jgi:hypothetical protein